MINVLGLLLGVTLVAFGFRWPGIAGTPAGVIAVAFGCFTAAASLLSWWADRGSGE